jgi:hypothetical protein
MEMKIEAEHVRYAVSLAVPVFLILCAAVRPLREWLFGEPSVNDDGGFPWSRNKKRGKKT